MDSQGAIHAMVSVRFCWSVYAWDINLRFTLARNFPHIIVWHEKYVMSGGRDDGFTVPEHIHTIFYKTIEQV